MKPAFKILASNKDISDLLESRLLSIEISDEIGFASDSFSMELDDRDNIFDIPKCGGELEVFLGYDKDELYPMGKFIVDEVEIAGKPDKLMITGRSANNSLGSNLGDFKATKNYSWKEYTLLGIIQTISSRYGLKAIVDDNFKKILVNHIDQTDESDCSFMLRLAEDYGATLKIANGKLLFIEPLRGLFPDGTKMPTIKIEYSSLSNYRMRITERNKYGKVIAKYYDFDEAEEKQVAAGSSNPTYTLRDTFISKNQATLRAKGKLADIETGQYNLSFETIGNPLLAAESKIEIAGIREELKNAWIVKQVRHSFSSSGFRTSIEAVRPKI